MQELKQNFDCRGLDLKSMLDHGVHFGHRRGARDHMMIPYIYEECHGVHIIDVRQSVVAMQEALNEIYNTMKQEKHILFVSTKQEFRGIIEQLAQSTSSSYVCKWRGGMLTNWRTVIASVRELGSYNELLEASASDDPLVASLTKKEGLSIQRKRDKLHSSFAGIVGTVPDLLVTLSVSSDKLAIAEARNMGIPVIGIVDTNASPVDISYPIPGNDNSMKAIEYYCDLFSQAAIAGMHEAACMRRDYAGNEDLVAKHNAASEMLAKQDVVATAPSTTSAEEGVII